MTILVTGGAGFIGGNFVLDWIASSIESVINIDKLTYAGNLQTLSSIQNNPKLFKKADFPDTHVSAFGHFSIFYKFTKEHLIITAFWDNRQVPKKLLDILIKTKSK